MAKEAFKTWGDAVSEVREAIDFLRYYAGEAERIMQPLALPQFAPPLATASAALSPEAASAGSGRPGTGPKAGGPHYLLRFCAEQTVTVNTTAAGGNAALLAAPMRLGQRL